ncbi:MAG: patatin-like phospholipase family protein, partial [Limisphaerales bacterium]
PKIFKTNRTQAHGRENTFKPGFGVKIAEAVQASCSAFPFFKRINVTTSDGKKFELADGGYCANNPTLYAIADALELAEKRENIRVVSLGVGIYPEPKYWFYKKWIRKFPAVRLLQKTLDVNTNSMDQLRDILFNDVPTIRISDTFSRPEMATDLMEHNLKKLDQLYQRGCESYAAHEMKLKEFLK